MVGRAFVDVAGRTAYRDPQGEKNGSTHEERDKFLESCHTRTQRYSHTQTQSHTDTVTVHVHPHTHLHHIHPKHTRTKYESQSSQRS